MLDKWQNCSNKTNFMRGKLSQFVPILYSKTKKIAPLFMYLKVMLFKSMQVGSFVVDYIAKILEDLKSKCLLFVFCLFAPGEDPAITAEVLNRYLNNIVNWAKQI